MDLETTSKISSGTLCPGSEKSGLVQVNYLACKRLAALLKTKTIPEDREETDLPDFNRREISNFYLFLVTICHQTSPKGQLPLEGTVSGKRYRGWNYLSAKFEEVVLSDKRFISPFLWVEMNEETLSKLFVDATLGKRLSDWGRRAELIRDLGQVMLNNQWLWFEDIYEYCCHRIATEIPNLLDTLAQFQAYRDPVRKKSLYLLSVLHNNTKTHWEYVDEEKLGPPVDYHEVRGHLRIGTISVIDSSLSQKLFNGTPVTPDEDIAIRKAVYDAILLIAKLTERYNPSQLHYLFWNVLRTCCRHEFPYCLNIPSDCTLPDRYRHLTIHSDGERCPFSDVCTSVNSPQLYYEHVLQTDFY